MARKRPASGGGGRLHCGARASLTQGLFAGLFGNKFEDAAELLEKAANCFKLAKMCAFAAGPSAISALLPCPRLSRGAAGPEAADAYVKLSECHLKMNPPSKHEASDTGRSGRAALAARARRRADSRAPRRPAGCERAG